MQFSTATILSALALFATANPLASLEDTGPDPSQVYIQAMTYGGSGCPQGSVGQSISDDRQTFTLIFDNYVASVGQGIAITESRKNCQLNIKMHFPQGWTFSLLSSDYRGYAQLDKGVNGLQKSTYYFAGQTNQVSTQANFPGPQSRDYLVHDVVGVSSLIWAPCGTSAALNINSQVRIDTSANPNGNGELTTDSQDGKVQQLLHFQWKRC